MIVYSKVIAPNYHDPVWLSEAKAHLNIDGTDQDALITQKIVVASAMCEKYSGLSFMEQTRRVSLDRFPCGDVTLPYGPVSSITSFVYLDSDDVETEVDAADYTLDLQSGIARVRVLESWPYTNQTLNNVVIDYVTGVPLAVDVFPEAREAICRLVAKLYEHRGDSNDGGLMSEEITDLLDMIKVYWNAG